ncbi:DNA-binding protein H-NS, partial [Rubrimonas cliftonensis]
MSDIDLTALSHAELKKLEKDVGKAIANFEERQKAEA